MSQQLAELREALGEAGHRMTGPRMAVWQVVATSETHLTADEISEKVRQLDPTVNLSSVYRSLALFSELGLVRESNLGANEATHWEIAHPDEHFHLKCRVCGRVEHHRGDLVAQIDQHLADHHGFQAERVELLVTGLCQDCAGNPEISP